MRTLEGRPTPTGRHADVTIVIAAVLGGLFLGAASSLLQVLIVRVFASSDQPTSLAQLRSMPWRK
jgi:hypothetical protein